MLSRDSEDEFDQDLCLNLWNYFKKLLWKDELNPRVRCAFGNVLFLITYVLEGLRARFNQSIPCSFIVCLSIKNTRTSFWKMTLTLTKWSKSLQIELQRFIVEYLRSCFELYSRVGPSGNDKHIIARRSDDTKQDAQSLFVQVWLFIGA